MKLLWSNTDNKKVIDYVKENLNYFEYEYFNYHVCNYEEHEQYTEQASIEYVGDELVEDVFGDCYKIYVSKCLKCNGYTIDIEE